jgi:type II secretory ATPase GspE/PulE/Tfp pilus assembly ATPase PilB-like protein
MQKQRRQYDRENSSVPVRILYKPSGSANLKEMFGKTLDLSVGGVCLEVSSLDEVQELQKLHLQFPNFKEDLSLDAEMRWQMDTGNRHHAGLEFDNISSAAQLKIKKFIRRTSDNSRVSSSAPHVQYQKFIDHLKTNDALPSENQGVLDRLTPEDLYSMNGGLGLDPCEMAEIIAEFLSVEYLPSLQPIIVETGDMTQAFCLKNNVLPMIDDQGNEAYVLSNPFKSVWGSVLNQRGFQFDHYYITEPANIRHHINNNGNGAAHGEPSRNGSEPQMLSERDDRSSDGTFKLDTDSVHDQEVQMLIDPPSDGDNPENLSASREEAQRENVVQLVSQLLSSSVKNQASDIHIEPRKHHVEVRFRLDGVLKKKWELPKHLAEPIVSRIKIMAELDIAERRMPQDGGFRIRYNDREIDVRTSVIPENNGEKVVLRVLDKNSVPLELSDLGFKEKTTNLLNEALASTKGILYFTGPTGSGKTTSLYTCLSKLRDPKVNIQTVENPIEYNMEGVNQMQINTKAGLTFAKALRGILRQDPDILMLGEIRDYETLDIAAKAAMSGHLVLSTVHTNDAPSTVNRLINIGVDPYCVASTTRIIVAQRLLRRLCDKCKTPVEMPEEKIEMFPVLDQYDPSLFEPSGCDECDQMGYNGQMGVMECIPTTEIIREAIRKKKGADRIRTLMTEELGLNTLRGNALEKVAQGVTSIEEAVRITSS